MAQVTRLNHAVLYVSDVKRSQDFYQKAFGFEVVDSMGEQAVFLRSADTDNHHDLALMSVGANAPRPAPRSVGLYPLAWQVATIEELAEMAQRLIEMDALGGMSDHGVIRRKYAFRIRRSMPLRSRQGIPTADQGVRGASAQLVRRPELQFRRGNAFRPCIARP